MTKITKVHKRPYRERADLQLRLRTLKSVIEFLRDCDLAQDSKKRMLNHAIWEVTKALGDFTPEYRSRGVLEGSVGAKIEREHVHKRKGIVADILSHQQSLDSVLSRVIHCIVTKEEHDKLSSVLTTADGWSRYRLAGIEVLRCRDGKWEKHEV